MAAMERGSDLSIGRRSHGSEAQWPELVSRAVNDLSRIVHAEFRLAELGIKSLIEQEIDRALKIMIALGFLLCAAVCTVSAAIVGLHTILGLWWAALAIVAAVSGLAGVGFFLWAKRRPEPHAAGL
ncbi:MAG: phage holin family protein [Deltaproteobacteria bacterium]|nr:phage holin family protein [Deltaproteobacteria bacterium]